MVQSSAYPIKEKFNAITFNRFLVCLLRYRRRGRKMVIILDNAKYHHAVVLHSFLKKNSRILSLEFLPAYSPELNPIERVWKLTRKLCTHNTYFDHLDDLAHAVARQHTLWAEPNETLRKLCCIN